MGQLWKRSFQGFLLLFFFWEILRSWRKIFCDNVRILLGRRKTNMLLEKFNIVRVKPTVYIFYQWQVLIYFLLFNARLLLAILYWTYKLGRRAKITQVARNTASCWSYPSMEHRAQTPSSVASCEMDANCHANVNLSTTLNRNIWLSRLPPGTEHK